MKLLLDEMWTPTIAIELRRRGFDARSPQMSEHMLLGTPVSATTSFFARAQGDYRTIVTDNVSDYERARRGWESRGQAHHGIIFALDPPFNRHRANFVIGNMVRALQHFLLSEEASSEPFNRAHYLRECPSD